MTSNLDIGAITAATDAHARALISLSSEPESDSSRDSSTDQLDKQILALQLSVKILTSRLSEVQQNRNSTVSIISRLPLELLVRIFHLTVLDGINTTGRPLTCHLVPLILTCKHWRDAVNHSPGLCSYICMGDAFGGRNARYLAQSGDCPLDVRFALDKRSIPEGMDHNSIQLMYDSFCEAATHLQRWKHAFLQFPASWSGFEMAQTLENPAPRLETAFLRHSGSEETPFDLNLFAGQAENLRELSIHGITTPWDSAIFTNLRVLSISRTGYPGPSILSLLRILRQCPTLIHFALENMVCDDDDVAEAGSSPIHLDYLNTLQVSSIYGDATLPLLSRIVAPSCKSVTYDLHLDHRRSTEEQYNQRADWAIATITPYFRSTVQSEGEEVSLNLELGSGSEGYVTCRLTSEGGGDFNVCLDGVDLCDMLNRLAHMLESVLPTAATAITFKSFRDTSGALSVFEALAQFECITSIKVTRPFDAQHTELVRFLTEDAGSRFPQLHTLSMAWNMDSLVALRQMVETRAHSSPFKSLTVLREVEPVDDTGEGDIEALVGAEGMVAWTYRRQRMAWEADDSEDSDHPEEVAGDTTEDEI